MPGITYTRRTNGDFTLTFLKAFGNIIYALWLLSIGFFLWILWEASIQSDPSIAPLIRVGIIVWIFLIGIPIGFWVVRRYVRKRQSQSGTPEETRLPKSVIAKGLPALLAVIGVILIPAGAGLNFASQVLVSMGYHGNPIGVFLMDIGVVSLSTGIILWILEHTGK